MKVKADYAVISNEYAGNRTLFLGNGTQLVAPGVMIQTDNAANVLLEKKGNGILFLLLPVRLLSAIIR